MTGPTFSLPICATMRRLSSSAWAEIPWLGARNRLPRLFAQAYGVPPKVFRAELRTRNAWLRITRTGDPLSAIAAETGFSDQSHMTRWIQVDDRLPASHWRVRSVRAHPATQHSRFRLPIPSVPCCTIALRREARIETSSDISGVYIASNRLLRFVLHSHHLIQGEPCSVATFLRLLAVGATIPVLPPSLLAHHSRGARQGQ